MLCFLLMTLQIGFKPVYYPLPKLKQCLCLVKDPVGLNAPEIQSSLHLWGKKYVGWSGPTILEWLAEHLRYIRLNQPEKSGLATRCLKYKHQPMFHSTFIISRTDRFWNRVILGTIFISTEFLEVNREMGQDLSTFEDVA